MTCGSVSEALDTNNLANCVGNLLISTPGVSGTSLCVHKITPASLYPDSSALVDLYRSDTLSIANVHPDSASIVHAHFQASPSEHEASTPGAEDIRIVVRAHCQQGVPLNDCVCRACGTGDNTVGHWSRWCIVPLVAASRLLNILPFPGSLNQIAVESDRHTAVCSLVVAQFRRLLRQEGAFLHQDASLAKPPTWWIDELLSQITSQAHLQLRLERFLPPTQQVCTLSHANMQLTRSVPISLHTLHHASLQVVIRTEVAQGEIIGNVDINSEFAAA